VADLEGGEPKKLSSTLNPAIDPDDLVDGEVVRFASYDGVEIPGVLYKPHQASTTNKVPAVVWVHGGPGGQSRVGYNEAIQYMVNGGYAVYAINNRGSSGYGKTFFQMDDKKHGEADLDDVVASKRMLIDTGWVNPDQIGIVGGSYGGYMTLAALTFRPEEFAAGIDLFGISNWPRVLESIPPWWESFKEALYQEMGDPAEDAERLNRISPLFHSDQIQRPLMVLQGANDPRVLQEESDDIVEAVRANGVPVEYIVFEDEGHGFAKKENRQEAYSAMRDFLDRYLAGDGAEEGDGDGEMEDEEAAA
jgi:dipeptidyl aminopeptidase/acylaminoacyl peptidase